MCHQTTIDVVPHQVPDENPPIVADDALDPDTDDAPSGYGATSWQVPATGKTNWHARYLADGDALTEGLTRFEELLALPEPDLEAWIMRGRDVAGSALAPLIGELRAFHGLGDAP